MKKVDVGLYMKYVDQHHIALDLQTLIRNAQAQVLNLIADVIAENVANPDALRQLVLNLRHAPCENAAPHVVEKVEASPPSTEDALSRLIRETTGLTDADIRAYWSVGLDSE